MKKQEKMLGRAPAGQGEEDRGVGGEDGDGAVGARSG